MIYRYALYFDQGVTVTSHMDLVGNDIVKHYQTPGSLQTCHDMRKEASSIYYSSNAFVFNHPTRAAKEVALWLDSLDTADFERVEHIKPQGNRKTYTSSRAAHKFDDLKSHLEDAGIELPGHIVTVDVESSIQEGELPCCDFGHCRKYNSQYKDAIVHEVSKDELEFLIAMETQAAGDEGDDMLADESETDQDVDMECYSESDYEE